MSMTKEELIEAAALLYKENDLLREYNDKLKQYIDMYRKLLEDKKESTI